MTPEWKKTEREFEDVYARMGKGAFVHRMSDTAAAKATSGKKAFVKAQPSDYLVTVNGHTFYAEVKSSHDPVAFHHSNIQPYQMAASKRITKAGGDYVFFIKNILTGKWYCVPASVIHASATKSTKWADIETYPWIFE